MTSTFGGCTSLTDMSSYIIPASVTNMQETFEDCTKLTKAPEMPSGVEVTEDAFYGCIALATGPSVIPAGVKYMEAMFEGCKALTGTMQINASPSQYNWCFKEASTNTGTSLKVNYTSGNASIIDAIIQTGTGGSHIERGVQN